MAEVPEIRVRGRGVHITDELRSRVSDKVGRSTRYFSRVGGIDVHIQKMDHRPDDAGRFRVEIAARPARHDVRAEGQGDTVDHALTAAADRFSTRLRRLGDRLADRRRQRPPASKGAGALGGPPPAPAGQDAGSDEIVREPWRRRKPMTPEDAALVLEEAGVLFLVFVNGETGRPAVLHRRGDGRLGLIDTA